MATIRSSIFHEFDPNADGNETFVRDLKRLLDISVEGRNLILARLSEILNVQTTAQKQKLLRVITEQAPDSGTDLRAAVNALTFFARRFSESAPDVDSPDLLAGDLHSLRLIDEQQKELLIEILSYLWSDVVPEYQPAARRRVVGTGVGPSLTGVGATVELRALQDVRYDATRNIDEYQPMILGVVGVASISILTNDTHSPSFFFQATQEELELLVNVLRAAQKDLAVLETTYVPVEHNI